ncbi:MAG: tetratricopeptide repeat protein, partial [Phycisphaerales bacterium]
MRHTSLIAFLLCLLLAGCGGRSYYLGQNYLERGLYDKAISEFTRSIKMNPKSAKAYYGRGTAYSDKGQYGLA